MECRCGGSTGPAVAVNNKKKILLDYQICKACGRVGSEILFINDIMVESGEKARKRYDDILEGREQ